MNALKHCFNPKVLAALAAIAVAVFIFAPQAAIAVLPFLLIAACPLSMILMMKTMNGKGESAKNSCSHGKCEENHKRKQS
jgi:hypothetical protein